MIGRSDPDIEVSRDDQNMINEFGRLNNRRHEVESDLKVIKDQSEQLDDAVTELMMVESETVRLFVGETFIDVSEEYATESCEKKQAALRDKVDELTKETDSITTRQTELKKRLYARFGASINLEEGPEKSS